MTGQIERSQMMGPWLTTALVVGTMIGSGIFLLPVSLAPLGINAIAGWLLSIAGALSIAFAFARLARLGGGGIQSYIEQVFGPFVGFLVTWSFWVANWVSVAAVAISFGAAISRVSPALGPASVIPLALAATIFLTGVNALGVKVSGALNFVTIAIKIVPLLGVVALLAVLLGTGGSTEPLAATPLSLGNVATAVTLTLFAMLGFENATTPVGKIRNPERTLPRAIFGGTVMVGLLYLLSSTGVTLLLPADVAASSPAPYADVYASSGGEALAIAAAFAIAVGGFGALNCLVLASGELGYAMAERGQLPAIMARVTARGTPVAAQVVGSGLAILAVLANSSRSTAGLFTLLILVTTSATLVTYLAATLAAGRLNRTAGARVVLGLALMFIAFAFFGAGREANLWCLALIAVGVLVYLMTFSFRGSNPAVAPVPAVLRE